MRGGSLDFLLETDLTQDELMPDVQIDILVQLAVTMTELCGETSRQAVLALLTAAAITAIRAAPPGSSIAPDFRELALEAMSVARFRTKSPPYDGSARGGLGQTEPL
jgi:hypothetical protein